MHQNKEQKTIKELLLLLTDEKLIVGYRLPSERSLSEKLNTSRSTIRSALKALQARDVLEVRAGSGCYLKSKNNLEALLRNTETDNKKQISESLEAFYLFEPLAVALAAERMKEESVARLEKCIVDLSKAILIPDIEKVVENHKNFHQIIVEATGNDFMVKTLQRFELTYVLVSNMMNHATMDQRNLIFALHVNLFKAIKDRNPAMAKAASEEMIMSTSVLMSQYEEIELPQLISDKLHLLSRTEG